MGKKIMFDIDELNKWLDELGSFERGIYSVHEGEIGLIGIVHSRYHRGELLVKGELIKE